MWISEDAAGIWEFQAKTEPTRLFSFPAISIVAASPELTPLPAETLAAPVPHPEQRHWQGHSPWVSSAHHPPVPIAPWSSTWGKIIVHKLGNKRCPFPPGPQLSRCNRGLEKGQEQHRKQGDEMEVGMMLGDYPSPSSQEIGNFKTHLVLFPHSFRVLRVTWARSVSSCPQGYGKNQVLLFCKLIFPTATCCRGWKFQKNLHKSQRSCKAGTFRSWERAGATSRRSSAICKRRQKAQGRGADISKTTLPTNYDTNTAKLEETSVHKHCSKHFIDLTRWGQHRSKTRGITHLPGLAQLVPHCTPLQSQSPHRQNQLKSSCYPNIGMSLWQ